MFTRDKEGNRPENNESGNRSLYDVLDDLKARRSEFPTTEAYHADLLKEATEADERIEIHRSMLAQDKIAGTTRKICIVLELLSDQPPKRMGRQSWKEEMGNKFGVKRRAFENWCAAAQAVTKAREDGLLLTEEIAAKPITTIPKAIEAIRSGEDVHTGTEKVRDKEYWLKRFAGLGKLFERVLSAVPKNLQKACIKAFKNAATTLFPPKNPSDESTANDWYTPAFLLELVRLVIGSIDLDPASSEKANTNFVHADYYYTMAEDGLTRIWKEVRSLFCNPPWGKDVHGVSLKTAWVKKLLDEFKKGTFTEGILLISYVPKSKWFRLCEHLPHVVLDRDWPFKVWKEETQEFEDERQRYDVAAFYFGPNQERFRRVFEPYGRYYPPKLYSKPVTDAAELDNLGALASGLWTTGQSNNTEEYDN